jgi:hypothetical protein
MIRVNSNKEELASINTFMGVRRMEKTSAKEPSLIRTKRYLFFNFLSIFCFFESISLWGNKENRSKLKDFTTIHVALFPEGSNFSPAAVSGIMQNQ